jgi:hypothetical protein
MILTIVGWANVLKNADHMNTGEEKQVGQILAQWADSLTPQKAGPGKGPVKR